MFRALKSINTRIGAHVIKRHVSSVGKIIENKEELRNLLSKPTWRLLDLIEDTENNNNDIQVTRKTLKRILKLSGFNTEISEEREQSLLKSLNLQMTFIKYLYKNEHDYNPKEESNEYTFRLLESDHKKVKPTTLENLMKEIELLPEKIDADKGEVPESFKVGQLSTENKNPDATVLKINLK